MAGNVFGVKDVANVRFLDYETKRPMWVCKTLKLSNLENTAQTQYANGGSGNQRLVGWDYDRQATFKMQNALFDPQALAMQVGTEVVENKTGVNMTINKMDENRYLTLNATDYEVELSGLTIATGQSAGKPSDQVYIYTVNPNGSVGAQVNGSYIVDTNTAGDKSVVVFTAQPTLDGGALVASGTKLVAFYDMLVSDPSAKLITISADKFPSYFTVVADALIRNVNTKKDEAFQIYIPCAKLMPNTNITMQAEGEPSVFDFDIEVYKETGSTEMVRLIAYTN